MRDPWILIALGAVLIVLPLWITRRESGNSKPRAFRDRVQTAARSDPTTMTFFAGLRIGVELAGAILIAIGFARMLGWAV